MSSAPQNRQQQSQGRQDDEQRKVALSDKERAEREKALHTFLDESRSIIDRAINDQFRGFLTAESLIASALEMCQNEKDGQLIQCPHLSILYALTLAGRTGLRIGPPYKESYLIARWNSAIKGNWCYWDPSYIGLMKLARRTGTIASIQAYTVRQNDHFAYRNGDDDLVEHVPVLKDRGPLTHAFCVVKFLNGAPRQFVVLDSAAVDRHKKASKGSGSIYSPWQVHPGPMWRKSAVREMSKWLELSDEYSIAIDAADSADTGVIDRAVNLIAPGQQIALPPASGTAVTLSDEDEQRQPVGRQRATINLDTIRPALQPNRGHGAEGFGPDRPEPKPPATSSTKPRTPAPEVRQPEKPEPGARISNGGLAQIRRAIKGWSEAKYEAFLSEFGVDEIAQLQASVFREVLTYLEAVNGTTDEERPDAPQTSEPVVTHFTATDIGNLEKLASLEGLEPEWIHKGLVSMLGVRELSDAPIEELGRAETLIAIEGLATKTGSDLQVALTHFDVGQYSQLTDRQLTGVHDNLKAKHARMNSPFEGQ